MKKNILLALAVFLILAGVGVLLMGLPRPVTIVYQDHAYVVQTSAFTVSGALQDAGLRVQNADQVQPAPESWLGDEAIYLQPARPVFWSLDGQTLAEVAWSSERIPANLLAARGVKLFPGDRVFWNGQMVDPDQALPYAPQYILQYQAALPLRILDNGTERLAFAPPGSLAGALWESGVRLRGTDFISTEPGAPFTSPVSVVVERSRTVTIHYAGGEIETLTSAATVGQALSEAGIALQGLDYSIPADDRPLPLDGEIRVVRVREEIVLEQTAIPFTNQYVADPELQLDSTRVVEAGQPGVEVSRVRARFEDGKEVSRVSEAQWVASPPKDQQLAYGTKIVIMTKQTPTGTISYWRAVRVYATSFAPCKYPNGRCSWSTASGIRLTTGIVAVPLAWWYLGMSRQPVYVDNYGPGIIGDTGGMTGHWIDLGYDDANYVGWYSYTTIYFLTPVPANVPWILP